jgi:hypothetical protein
MGELKSQIKLFESYTPTVLADPHLRRRPEGRRSAA